MMPFAIAKTLRLLRDNKVVRYAYYAEAIPDRVDYETVNHPEHYTSHPSGVECIEIAEHMSYNLGSVLKYIWRGGLKVSKIEDLKKAKWFIDREIQRIHKGKENSEN